jgi:pimeloyl-ACP methyl ester carboxylesterase
LKERNHSSLAINLSLGIDDRHGAYECAVAHRHRHEDAADEIGAWLDWLHLQGAKRVVLLGHSRGGAQTALFAAERDHALVTFVVLLAPATRDNGDRGYEQRFKQPLQPLLARAQELVKAGKGDTLLAHANILSCLDTQASAASFASYYGPDPRLDTPYLLPKITKPVLVVVAGGDDTVVGLDKKLAPIDDGTRPRLKVIDGADHFFRDLYADDAVDAIVEFVAGTDHDYGDLR